MSRNTIPSSWSVKKISEVAVVTMGASPSSTSYNDDKIGLPLIQGNADCANRKTKPRIYTSEITKKCKVGDIIMTVRAPVGAISKSNHVACIGRGVCAIDSKINNEFLYQSLVYHENSWGKLSQGSTFEAVSGSDIKGFKISVPPLKEQEKIAEILSTWDSAIEKQEQLIEKKKEFKKGLMQILLSGEVRFKEFNDNWEKKKIGSILEEDKVIAVNPDINKRLTVRLNLKGIEKREIKSGEIEGATTHYTRRAGQFIYGKQNLHKGALAIIPNELDGFQSSSDLPAFNFNKDIYPLWFFYFISRESYYTQLEKIATGTGSKRIQPKELFEITIKTPEYDEQVRIAEVLKEVDKEIELLEKELEVLKLQKKGLMQRLLTGEVRVKV